ncbi:hypothetical protein [Gordonia sp. NPDC003950]
MLALPEYVSDVSPSGLYGIHRGRPVPVTWVRGTLYLVAWADSPMPEGFDPIDGVDPATVMPRGQAIGRREVSEDEVSSLVQITTVCQWKNTSWSIIGISDTRCHLQRGNSSGDTVDMACRPGPGRGAWYHRWPGVEAMSEDLAFTTIDHAEAAAVRVKRRPWRSSGLATETFSVRSPARSPYLDHGSALEMARHDAGVDTVERMRDGWCSVDGSGVVVFAVADTATVLTPGRSRAETEAHATTVCVP